MRRSVLLFFGLILFLFNACKEDDSDPVEPVLEDPNFDEFSIIESISFENESTPAFSNVIVRFYYPLGKQTTLTDEKVTYRPRFGEFVANTFDLSNASFVWNADSTQLSIEPEKSWRIDQEMYFNVTAYWERLVEGSWEKRDEDVIDSTLATGAVPEILGIASISEGDYLNIFENINFTTHVPLDTAIGDFSPFIDNIFIVYKNDTLPTGFEAIPNTHLVEIVPESFLPLSELNEDLNLHIEASWRKNVNNEWVNIKSEETKINFRTKREEIEVDFFPKGEEQKVSVYFNPSLKFNYPMGEPLELNSSIRPNYTVVRLEDSNAQQLNADVVWPTDKRSVEFNMIDLLPENETITFIVNVYWERLINEEWQSLGAEYETEYKSVFYTTSKENSELLSISEFEYSYPLPFQINFLKAETNQGYIKLKAIDSEVENIIYNTPAADFYAVFKNIENTYNMEVPLSYNQDKQQFSYSIPSDLPNDEMLLLELWGHDGVKAVSLCQIYFGTSAYNTLQEKIDGMTLTSGARRPIREGVHELMKTYLYGEVFDYAECQTLISMSANLEGNDYYNNDIYPLIYDGVIRGELDLSWRDGSEYGMIPEKAVYLRQYPSDKEASYADYASNQRPYITDLGAMIYNLADIYEKDHRDLKEQISAINTSDRSDWMNQLVSSSFPAITKGNYNFIISYTLPGTGEVTSEISLSFDNPVE